ncbi:MAG: hypothetical protein ACJ76Y_11150 [Thermoanaerobaculia bacterium]
MTGSNGLKALRIVVFLVGLGEFLTSVLLLFLPQTYKAIFGLAPGFDSYYIQQIGMFQFLVGSAILIGSRQAENPPVFRFAVYFNVVSLVFWVYFLLSRGWQPDLFHYSVAGFMVYHTVMTAILFAVGRRAGVA